LDAIDDVSRQDCFPCTGDAVKPYCTGPKADPSVPFRGSKYPVASSLLVEPLGCPVQLQGTGALYGRALDPVDNLSFV
jgi:hypothetical protein